MLFLYVHAFVFTPFKLLSDVKMHDYGMSVTRELAKEVIIKNDFFSSALIDGR